MVGLRDVARAARVSIRTVNRALKDKGYISAATSRRVLAAAKRLGYRPHRAARRLRTGKSYEVSVVMGSLDELHVAKTAALEHVLRRAEYSVDILFGPQKNDGRETPARGIIEELLERRPGGAVLFPQAGMPLREIAAGLAAEGIPCVAFDTDEPAVDAVRIDRQQGVYDAVHYLARKGRRRIAYLGPLDARTRLEGYQRAVAELGREPIYLQTESGEEAFAWGRKAAARLTARREQPDAVQAHSDVMALGFLAGLYDRGVRVPAEVAVVGFDDRAAAAYAAPPLTTVAQPNAEVGRAAAEILLQKIAGATAPAGGWSRSLPTRLVVRESA